MAEIITQLLSKRRNRSSANSDDSVSSLESKKNRKIDSSTEIWTAINMSQNFAGKLEEILEKLKKLDVIESSVKNIEGKISV